MAFIGKTVSRDFNIEFWIRMSESGRNILICRFFFFSNIPSDSTCLDGSSQAILTYGPIYITGEINSKNFIFLFTNLKEKKHFYDYFKYLHKNQTLINGHLRP